jgi:hypothetical protein
MWPFNKNASSSSSQMTAVDSGDGDVYSELLPASMPVVKKTVDLLSNMAVKQRMFISEHAANVKLELLKEPTRAERTGAWFLNGFPLEDEDAVDFVRACPDALSNLTFVSFQDQTGLWTRITSWLQFKTPESKNMNIVDDLGYILSVAEVIEITGHVLSAVSYVIADAAPKSGSPVRRQLAFELVSSRHRGTSHSMYLVSELAHTAERIASHSSASTLRVSSHLYIYQPLLLGGIRGTAVNVGGQMVDNLPAADLNRDELRDLLSKKGRFVSSSTSDFVLDPQKIVSSERAAKIATLSSGKLVVASNEALLSFFDTETAFMEDEREQAREVAAQIAAEEAMEEQIRQQQEEERVLAEEAASNPQSRYEQQVRYDGRYQSYYDEDYDDYDEYADYR